MEDTRDPDSSGLGRTNVAERLRELYENYAEAESSDRVVELAKQLDRALSRPREGSERAWNGDLLPDQNDMRNRD